MVFGLFSKPTAESITKKADKGIELSDELTAYYDPLYVRVREIYDSLDTLTQEQAQALLGEMTELDNKIFKADSSIMAKRGELDDLRDGINKDVTNASEQVKSEIKETGIYTNFTKAFDRRNTAQSNAFRSATVTSGKLKKIASGEVKNDAAQQTPPKKDDSGQNSSPRPQNSARDDAANTQPSASQNTPSTVTDAYYQTNSVDRPGRRLYNPLSLYASYTYRLSLYIVTPQTYDLFMNSGRQNLTDISQGVYLVAQSGGITESGTVPRAPGFEFDYYIDNLKFRTTTGANNGFLESNITTMDFNIIEPNGFSFITRLAQATRAVGAMRFRASDDNNPVSSLRQFFILQIKFQGYDQNGEPVKENGVIEQYIDVFVTQVRFKIDGKHTNYQFKAASLQPYLAQGTQNGTLTENTSLQGDTVFSVLADPSNPQSLLSLLRTRQQHLVNSATGAQRPLPMEYDFVFIGKSQADIDRIKNSRIVIPADLDNLNKPANASDFAGRTVKFMQTNLREANVTNERRITLKAGTNMIKAISLVVSASSYLTDGLSKIFDGSISQSSAATDIRQDSDARPIENRDNSRVLRWYNLSSRVSNLRYDPARRDYVFKTTFVIQPYDTPSVLSAFANNLTPYYGPHKRYEYWFTGKNTEIMSYEQQLNNHYYLSDFDRYSVNATGSQVPIPTSTGQLQPRDRSLALGIGNETQASYLTSLYSPGDWSTCKIRILGDPDFIIQDTPASLDLKRTYQQFYADDTFTISANGGQVFIEISFREGIDYDYEDNDGTLSINSSILFWDYPPEVAKQIRGISYRLRWVESEFSRGSFTQTLDAVINPFADFKSQTTDGARSLENQQTVDYNPVPPATVASQNPDISAQQPRVQPEGRDEVRGGP